ncbi:MAG: hypothetical protein Fur0034_21850 [Desulfuromonadia bacterium]
MKRYLLIFPLLVLLIAACGDIQWLPSDGVSANEPTPDPFTFTPKLCASPSTVVESGETVITNVSSPATVSVKNGEYLATGGTWTSESKLYTPGTDKKLTIKVRHTTAAVTGSSPVVVTTLTVGKTTGLFYSDISTDSTWCR